MRARAAIAQHPNWEQALESVLLQTDDVHSHGGVALAVLFASAEFSDDLEQVVARTRAATGAQALIGCAGQGIIGTACETEGAPALSLLLLVAPGAQLSPCWISPNDVEQLGSRGDWASVFNVPRDDLNALLIFADPFSMDCESLIEGLADAYPGRPIAGGLASGSFAARRTHVFLNNNVYDSGAVGLGISGSLDLHIVVSQGATPIGEPWTVTGANGHVVTEIGQRPAYEVLVETFQSLPAEIQLRVQRNLLVGLAIDEYKDFFGRGDFLIRNLLGIDTRTGAIAIGAHPHVGQTIQFQLRDAGAADEDLRLLLDQTATELGSQKPVAGILCSCNGRGVGLFGVPHHDAGTISDRLGPVPLAGLFCNGEIGPVGRRPFLHGYTASIALFVERR